MKLKKGANQTTIQAEGQEYILSNFDFDKPWDVKDIQIEDIERFKDHWMSDKIRENIKNLVFQGEPILNVLDEKGNSREDIAVWLRQMAESLDYYEKMQIQFDDEAIYGSFFKSKGVEEIGNKKILTEVRCLPPTTFVNAGQYYTGTAVYGRIFKGIVRYEDGSIHYWQTRQDTGFTEEIKNCEHIKSSKSSYYLDGIPLLNPLYKLLPKLNFGMEGLMLANNKENSIFIQMGEKTPLIMPDQKTSTWSYLTKTIQSFSRIIHFILPSGATVVEPKSTSSKISIDTIDLITKLIIRVYSPSDFLSLGESNRLGGSTAGETTLVKSFVQSLHSHITKYWIDDFQQVLEWNGYSGFKVQIILPQIKEDNEEINIKKAVEIRTSKKGSVNEYRELLGLEDADEVFLKKCEEEWGFDDSQQENSQQKDESMDNEEIQEDIKQNQGATPTREEIEADTKKQLDDAWSKCFAAIEKLEV